MYHDSDDEPLSGDEEEEEVAPKRRRLKSKKRSPEQDVGRKGVAEDGGGGAGRRGTRGSRRSDSFGGYNIYPVIVVDYDLTLVDRSSRPFKESREFISALREFNGGRNQLILYSHGSPAYIDEGLNKHYSRERKYFDVILSDSSASNNKPVSQVRRVIKRVDHLIGPYVIIDDNRSNLDENQYDIVIDVTRMTKYDPDGRAVSVDYEACMCVLVQGVETFLKTKQKHLR